MDWLPTLVKETVAASPSAKHQCESSVEQLLATTVAAIRHYRAAQSGCPVHVVIMSNGGFAGIHQKLIDQLRSPL
jgi:UDP-N-acetylmuramate: L-alanyl-gamma-D-glutamyl-meso-diaminopimelate ligase